MGRTFKLIFTGELKPGADPEAVAAAFASAFHVGEGKARKLMEAGREVELKKGLEESQAERARVVLEGIGMRVRVEPMETPDLALEPLAEGLDTGAEDDEPSPEADPSPRPRCPKCGSERVESDSCLDCGIILSKYLAIQERRRAAEDEPREENPYAAPQAELVAEDDEGELAAPQTVPAGHGWAWLARGFWHFKEGPLAWILMMVIWIVLAVVANFIPLVGPLAVSLLSPVLMAGFMIGARAQDEGAQLQVAYLFEGFSRNLSQLVLVGVLYLCGMMVIVFVGVAMLGGTIFQMMSAPGSVEQNPELLREMMQGPIIVASLVMVALMMPLLMAYWFAPALVALEDLTAFSAMKLSFFGCLKNVMPFLVYGILGLVLLLIGMIPFGLGLLVVLPVLTASIYASYRDIYYA